ncbi:MAG: histidine kinase, partial [Ignavibacteriae bacterium]|nr:histidine kinase [Ignavibacteriota bacterium]
FRKEDLKKNELAFANLRTSRLETEMLKKIIQPHYIMNSLNAVIEWIEESPKEGLRFIKELSDEFRSFLTFSDQKLITIKDELQLCERHIKIMEFRQHKKYTLVNNLQNLNKKIPPAIIHTLVENGISHHQNNSKKVCFIIEEHNDKNLFELKVIVNYNGDCSSLSTPEEIVMKNNFVNFKKIKEGNGLKYIRSRLTESYGDNWELQYFGDETIWITIIKIINETDK